MPDHRTSTLHRPSPKSILFAWELGVGLGHLMPMLPLAEDLAKTGHRVYVAMRNLSGAASVFGQAGVHFLPAAFKTEGGCPMPRCCNYADLLANVGWHNEVGLFGIACAWRNLIKLADPDLVVFDHSPTALLASRGLPLRRLVMGLGFFCPPDVTPFPALRKGATTELLAADQQKVLGRANGVLQRSGQPPMQRLGQLFSDVDETFLATFPELDHYGRREGVRYWGPVLGSGALAPRWPDAPGRRIYAYLKGSAGVEEILAGLAGRGLPTLVYATGIAHEVRQRFESPTLRFETRALDMSAVARDCDLAVLNANHGTLCHLLLAGKPVLMLPLHLEQQVLASRLEELGVGLVASAAKGCAGEFAGKLDAMLSDDRYARAAVAFAGRHADFDPARQRREMFQRALELLDGDPTGHVAHDPGLLATLSAGLSSVGDFCGHSQPL